MIAETDVQSFVRAVVIFTIIAETDLHFPWHYWIFHFVYLIWLDLLKNFSSSKICYAWPQLSVFAD